VCKKRNKYTVEKAPVFRDYLCPPPPRSNSTVSNREQPGELHGDVEEPVAVAEDQGKAEREAAGEESLMVLMITRISGAVT
jgi:hypothetical protein